MVAEQTTISLRVTTRGELTDFLEREKKECAHSNKVISGIIGKLWNYREEGVDFSPSVVYTDDIVEFSKKLPGFSHLLLGDCVASEDSAKKILKDCAPLTGESSLIFVERKECGGKLDYGIFSFLRSPTAIGIEEALALDENQFAVLIKKSSPTALQIIGSKGNSVSILMSTVRETDNSQVELGKFVKDLISGIDGDCEAFEKYLGRLFSKELTDCHGTILICATENMHPDIVSISDKISLNEGVDFFTLFEDFRKQEDAESLLKLQRAEDLLRGFLSCDGMIAFSIFGKILSYRIFFKPDYKGIDFEVVGGARRRAFEGISALKSNSLKSTLFRSQDGTTAYKEIADELV
ncbi:MAG: hypothetical protein P1V13_19985 [Rhizobiaceae bacterium]|nr:hypothetical protein [Rhizobiaceae bacterium]